MDFQFVILNPDKNSVDLQKTLNSINVYSYNRKSISVVGENTTAIELKELNKLCPTYKAKATITSLINSGINEIRSEWAVFLFGGTKISAYFDRRIQTFCKKENDILFPVYDQKWGFLETPFNGVAINKNFFKKIGPFPDVIFEDSDKINDFELSKTLWTIHALDKKAIFKAIIGLKIS